MDTCREPIDLLAHIKTVQQTRELVGAISAFAKEEAPRKALQALHSSIKGTRTSSTARSLTDAEAQIVLQVLKDVEHSASFPQHPHSSEHSAEVLRCIREAIFAERRGEEGSLMTLVYSSSFLQATQTLDLCTSYVLHQALDLSNCFQLLKLGLTYSIPDLVVACLATSLYDFNNALASDTEGFYALDKCQVLAVIGSTELQVDTELDVFKAIVKWTEHSSEARKTDFADLIGKGVRMEFTTRSELAEVDSNPLVVACKEASALVAMAYMRCCYGDVICPPSATSATAIPRRKLIITAGIPFHSPCTASVASCNNTPPALAPQAPATQPKAGIGADFDSGCSGLPCIPEDGETDHIEVFAESGCSHAKMHAGGRKRKASTLSPLFFAHATPALRQKRLALEGQLTVAMDLQHAACEQQKIQDQPEAGLARLPAQRRLF